MKKTVLTLCIGMMIGLLAGSVTGTFAAIGDRVEAVVAEYIIMVDGVEQVLETAPVAINNSTYVPLRAMANMLDKDVIYKSDSRTIELNTPVLEVDAMDNWKLDAINEQIRRLEFFNNELAESKQDKIETQNQLQILINELKEDGQSEDEINKHPRVSTDRIMIQSIEKQISDLEQLITEIEAQKAQWEADTTTLEAQQ